MYSVKYEHKLPDLCNETKRPRQLKHMQKGISLTVNLLGNNQLKCLLKGFLQKILPFFIHNSLCILIPTRKTTEPGLLHLHYIQLHSHSPTSHFLIKYSSKSHLQSSFLKRRPSLWPRTHAVL